MSGNVPLGAINAFDREALDLKSERAVANSPARGGGSRVTKSLNKALRIT